MSSKVGPYLLTETLGKGSFGKVKLATHTETGKQYAIKIMDKGDIKQNDLVNKVKQEIAIMKALNHRNIVNLREVLSSKAKLYIVMDLVRGGELFEMIEKQGELNEKIARRYFQQLVDGVEYCHRRGIYHRDLKPENLLVSEDGTLKITDFGVSSMKSNAEGGSDLLTTMCGTPYYAAPELLGNNEQGYSGSKVDVWAIGVILYLLLTGTLPFQDDDMNKLYEQIRTKHVEYPPEVPTDAKDLLDKMLEKNPEKRIDLTEVKKHPWFLVDYQGDIDASAAKGSAPMFKQRRDSQTSAGSGSNRSSASKLAASASGGIMSSGSSKAIESVDDSSMARIASDGGSGSSKGKAISPAVSVRNLTEEYAGKSLMEFVQAVLPGKPESKISDIVKKLEEMDIDCINDIQAVADTMKTPDKFRNWLEEEAKMPSVTSMRFSKMFFAE